MQLGYIFGGYPRTLAKGVHRLRRIANQFCHSRGHDIVAARLDLLRRWWQARENGLTASEAADAVGCPRATLYRWRAAYRRFGSRALKPRSRRPHRTRRRTARTPEVVQAVLRLRRQYPWGKELLAEVLLREQRITAAASSIGRIIGELLRKGRIFTAKPGKWGRRKQAQARTWAERRRGKPQAAAPGQVVQIDTVHANVTPDFSAKVFSFRDMASNHSDARAASNATSFAAARALRDYLRRAPFRVVAVQTDGGSEFRGLFEEECRRRGIAMFVNPPRSPKSNSKVENFNGTLRREFLNFVLGLPDTIAGLNEMLADFCHDFNHRRPNLALRWRDGARLRYLTPMEYINNHQNPAH